MGGEELKWRQLAHYHLISLQGLTVHTEKLNPLIKGLILGRMLSSGISHVAFVSVYSEKTRLKKCWSMIIRECGSTLYVGLPHALLPTNTNFGLTFSLTRLQEALYEHISV